MTFVDPIYNLYNIQNTYKIQFHIVRNNDYWSIYTRPNSYLTHTCTVKSQKDYLLFIPKIKWITQFRKKKKKSSYNNEGYNKKNYPLK